MLLNMPKPGSPIMKNNLIRLLPVELIPGQGKVVAFKPDDQNKINTLTYENAEYKRIK